MKNFNIKTLYIILIVIGAALVLYEQLKDTGHNIIMQAFGFMLLMFGLYKISTIWVTDTRPPAHEDEIIFFEEDEEQESEN